MKNATKKLLPSFLLLIVFVVACARLGWWQWNRAADYNKITPDKARVELSEIAKPGTALSSDEYGRLISTSGTYSRTWLVADRIVGDKRGDWQVALLSTSTGQLLVVRSWGASPLPSGEVKVEGRLYPAQTPETSASRGELVRVDPALLVRQVEGKIFDGYVIASSEEPSVNVDRVPSPQPVKNPPGFYWQHLSYVILWWFFGLLAVVVWARSARQELKR